VLCGLAHCVGFRCALICGSCLCFWVSTKDLNILGKAEIDSLIEDCVKKCEDQYRDADQTYVECLQKVRIAQLDDIMKLKNAKGKKVVECFLYDWGGMGRVLGREKYEGWENRPEEQIQSNLCELADMREKHLECVNLSDYEPKIRKCYESFKQAEISPIAVAKTLHLVCPDFFPPWDNSIEKAVRNELEQKEEKFSTSDYYKFMKAIQGFLKGHEQTFSELVKSEKGKLKIIDEFLWWFVRRPFHPFLKSS
jgi:hypothetical protein